jgi:hypothetical protein
MAQTETPNSTLDVDIDSTFGPEAQLALALMRAELAHVAWSETGDSLGTWAIRPVNGEAAMNPVLIPAAR